MSPGGTLVPQVIGSPTLPAAGPSTSMGSASRSIGNTALGPHFPAFVQVSRDGLTFYLTEPAGDCQGVAVGEPPDEGIEGLRSMTVVDPDGNQLRICTRLK